MCKSSQHWEKCSEHVQGKCLDIYLSLYIESFSLSHQSNLLLREQTETFNATLISTIWFFLEELCIIYLLNLF